MAADYEAMVRNLLSFYDFRGKTVIAVGAGGGQLSAYGHAAQKVFAVDHDPAALKQLRENLEEQGLAEKFMLVQSDFYRLELCGDVVLFEFCLHELADPEAAISRARTLAPDVVVFDHALGSPWAFCVAEEKKVQRSWQAVEHFAPRDRREYETLGKFRDYQELLEKVKPQGKVAIQRIRKWMGQKNISITMIYALALI